MPQPILLLRASSDPDPYHLALSSAHYTPYSISPLQTTIVNHAELAARISELPTVDAVIMTSARSAEAWRGAVLSVLGALDASAQRDNPALYAWHTLPFYVVGKATATALTTSDDAHPRLPIPKDVRGAEETGTSARLAQLIVEELQGKPAKALYLTGDKNKYNLPETLKEAGIDLDEMQVYETGGSETFGDELDALLQEEDSIETPWWIVFFAPSSSTFVLPHLRRHFTLPSTTTTTSGEPTNVPPTRKAKIAAIGPTTGDYLCDELGINVDIVSPKPGATDLTKAMADFDTSHT